MPLAVNKSQEQALAIATVAGGPIGSLRQYLGEIITYSVDYSGWLADGDTLSDVDIFVKPALSAPPVTIIGQSTSDSSVIFQISAPAFYGRAVLFLSAATSTGQVKVDTFSLEIIDIMSEVSQALEQSEFVTAEDFLQSLPTTLPATSGTIWWNGETLARTAGVSLTAESSMSPIESYLQSLPSTFPEEEGELWWNGGILSRS